MSARHFITRWKRKGRARSYSNLCASLKLALKTWKRQLRTDFFLRSSGGLIRTTTILTSSLNQKTKKAIKSRSSSLLVNKCIPFNNSTSTHGTFMTRNHIMGHKTTLKFKINANQVVFSDYKRIKLEINNRNTSGKSPLRSIIGN